MNIIFMGTPDFAVQILQGLVGYNIKAILTQSDKKVGRKQILSPSAVKDYALHNLKEVPIFTPKNFNNDELIVKIKAFKPDFIVVAAYGKILPKAVLQIAPCINLHASLLPKYRGASPIQSAILNGDEKSGVCAMLMNERLDEGDILKSVECDIRGKNAKEVFNDLANLASILCKEVLCNFNNLNPIKQDNTRASYCTKIKKEDGLVSLQNAKELYQKFLAFTPWPGIFLENGLKFIDIEFIDEKEHEKMGKILALEKDSFLLACKKGTLRIKKIQESGKKILDARVFLNGKRLKNEDNLC
ncbi:MULTISPECIES: methionyl-tRNA formyltransferase [unclassified Campylobacter]|uniref:methionyl-tRNA formyltransferase n=1 Tax=unclassified Campylobacter TaxID=2593542 RepID=UPI001CC1E49A|nr:MULTISPECIES: methionyl-tRNA formyltransferase [unclassified Campylobacter]